MKRLPFLILFFFAVIGIGDAQASSIPITAQNADQAHLVDVLGRGFNTHIRWIGDKIEVDSDSGIWEYDSNNIKAPPHRITQRIAIAADWCSTYSSDFSLRLVYPQCQSNTNSSVLSIENVTTGQQVATVVTSDYDIFTARFSDDNRIFAIRRCVEYAEYNGNQKCLRGEIVLWDIVQNKLIFSITHYPDTVQGLQFSGDSKLLISQGEAGLVLWDIEHGGIPLKVIPNAQTFLLSDNNHTLFYAIDNDIYIWHVDQKLDGPVWRGHEYPVSLLALSPDGYTLASSDSQYGNEQDRWNRNSIIRLWDVRTGREIASFSQDYLVCELVFSPSGQILVSISETEFMGSPIPNEVKLWNISSGQLINSFFDFTDEGFSLYPAVSIAFNSEETRIAILYIDGAIRIFDIASSNYDFTEGFGGRTYNAKLNPDGSTVMTSDGYVTRIWDIESGVQRFTLPGSYGIDYSPDGKQIVIVRESSFEFYDSQTGAFLSSIDHSLDGNSVLNVSFHPNGKILAVSDWNTQTNLVNLENGTVTHIPHGGSRELKFSPDGSILVMADWGATFLFDLSSRSIVQLPLNGFFLDLSRDGRLLALNQDHSVLVWNLVTNSLELRLDQLSGPAEVVGFGAREAAFSPDGKLLVTVQNGINFWDLDTGQLVSTLELSHVLPTSNLLFHPDGSKIITANARFPGVADESYHLEVMGILAIPGK